jgi:hypothetical protein
MSMTREQLFQLAKEGRKKERESSSKGKDFSNFGPMEEIFYAPLSTEMGRVIRIFGNPLVIREKPTDPKLVYISLILGDNKKKFRCIWPSKQEDPNWILWRIHDLVLAYTGVGSGIDYRKDYIYKDVHPECFKRVSKNNNTESQYEKGWKPTQYVLMNVIDRNDPEFHKEHKHSKILSKKATKGDGDAVWYEPGVPITTYNSIWDEVAEYYGLFDGAYDVVVKKLKDDPWYRTHHGTGEQIKLTEEEKSLVVDGPLTDEEKNYKLYDFDKLFAITSYTKILSRLGAFIKKIDFDFETEFYRELVELSDKEKEEWSKINSQEPPKPVNKPKPSPKPEPVSQPVVETKTRSVRTPKNKAIINWQKLYNGEYNGLKYLGVLKMTEEEKSKVVSINEDGSFNYDAPGEEILKNTDSDFCSPESFHIDPLSGDEFSDDIPF